MERMLTVKEVAALLAVSTRNVYRLKDAGRIPKPFKIGGATRWRTEDIQKWLNNGCEINHG